MVIFGTLNYFDQFRISEEIEFKGNDLVCSQNRLQGPGLLLCAVLFNQNAHIKNTQFLISKKNRKNMEKLLTQKVPGWKYNTPERILIFKK